LFHLDPARDCKRNDGSDEGGHKVRSYALEKEVERKYDGEIKWRRVAPVGVGSISMFIKHGTVEELMQNSRGIVIFVPICQNVTA
jgi:hypothetical protein